MTAGRFFQNLEKRRQTTFGLTASIMVEAALVYVIGSLAIDSGSLFDYVLAALLVILLVQDIVAVTLRSTKSEVSKHEPEASSRASRQAKKGKDRG